LPGRWDGGSLNFWLGDDPDAIRKRCAV